MKIFCLLSVLAIVTMYATFTADGAPGGGPHCGVAPETLVAQTDWDRVRALLNEQLVEPLRVSAGSTLVTSRLFTRVAPSWSDPAPRPMLVRSWELVALGPEPTGDLRLVRASGEVIAVGIRVDVEHESVVIDDGGATLTAARWLERLGLGRVGGPGTNVPS